MKNILIELPEYVRKRIAAQAETQIEGLEMSMHNKSYEETKAYLLHEFAREIRAHKANVYNLEREVKQLNDTLQRKAALNK